MPANNRSAARNVHVYDAEKPSEEELGGLVLTNGVTNKNLYAMINIIVMIDGPYSLRHNSSDTIVPEDDAPLQPGNYYIVTTGSVTLNNESWLIRTVSHSTGTRTRAFRNAVRSRDQRCIISGREALNIDMGLWTGFKAAHIFPLAHESYWIDKGFSQWITKSPANGGSINSVQNGLLLKSDIHQLFDIYGVTINPDDNYKVMFFVRDDMNIAGRHLDQRFLNNPDRPVDELLQWHFRQSVLANMRGAGEPIFEHDFPPGSDMIGEILDGPMAAKRMEFELFSRLSVLQEI